LQGDGTEASKVLLMENMLLRGYEEKAQIKETMNGKAPTLLVPQRQDKPTKKKSRKFKVVPVTKLQKPTKILLKVIAEQLRRRWHGTESKPKKRLDNFLLAALLDKETPNSVMTETELEAEIMIADITEGITAAGYEWKPDSLEVLPCGNLADTDIQLSVQQNNETIHFKTVEQLQLLGNLVTNIASTSQAMHHRLTQTEKAFGRTANNYGAKVPTPLSNLKLGLPSSTTPPPSDPDGGALI